MNDIIKAGFKAGFEKKAYDTSLGWMADDPLKALMGFAGSAAVGGALGSTMDTADPWRGAGWGATQAALMPLGLAAGMDLERRITHSLQNMHPAILGGLGGAYGTKKLIDKLWGY